MSERVVSHCYRDPLAEIWICAARKIGLQVTRTEDAFAHNDGKGTLAIASSGHLDDDDCLAQMIFHELCHSLVEGPEAFEVEDWGLDNTSREDDVREHAALRVQALLAGRHGLRRILGPTTNFRRFYDDLGADPLHPRAEHSTQLAITGVQRSSTNPWWPHLGKALEATAQIIAIAAQWPAPSQTPVLYRLREEALGPHPGGHFARDPELAAQCGACAWRDESGHCFQANRDVDGEIAACERFEVAFDCLDCGACCRSAYHSVAIAKGDQVAERHPNLVVHRDSYSEIRRTGDHCAALVEDKGRYKCNIYSDRPTCCREFENAGTHCMTARRRVGLSL